MMNKNQFLLENGKGFNYQKFLFENEFFCRDVYVYYLYFDVINYFFL